jgi:hypothetical protein
MESKWRKKRKFPFQPKESNKRVRLSSDHLFGFGNWKRKPVSDELHQQLVDGTANLNVQVLTTDVENLKEPAELHTQRGDIHVICPLPVFQLGGTTEQGHSVVLYVHGFRPYFFVRCPDRWYFPDDMEHQGRVFQCIAETIESSLSESKKHKAQDSGKKGDEVPLLETPLDCLRN